MAYEGGAEERLGFPTVDGREKQIKDGSVRRIAYRRTGLAGCL